MSFALTLVTPQTPTLTATGCTTVQIGATVDMTCKTDSTATSDVMYTLFLGSQEYNETSGAFTLQVTGAYHSGDWKCKVSINSVVSDDSNIVQLKAVGKLPNGHIVL